MFRDGTRLRESFPIRTLEGPRSPVRGASPHRGCAASRSWKAGELLATFTVTNLHSSGAGSLRQAIIASNAQPGADTIDFGVAGTIRIGRTSLPAITDTVTIDGTSAPSFAGSPVVTVNFQGTKGLQLRRRSDGSTLRSLSLVRAGNAGVTLIASDVTVQGNDIGLLANGKTVAGNSGDGVRINASSHGDLIGQVDPVTGVSYYNADSVSMQPVSGWQGIRDAEHARPVPHHRDVGRQRPAVRGADLRRRRHELLRQLPGRHVHERLRSRRSRRRRPAAGRELQATATATSTGFVFQGTTADLSNAGDYQTIDYPGATYTYVHSTMGDLAVGNADGPRGMPDSAPATRSSTTSRRARS